MLVVVEGREDDVGIVIEACRQADVGQLGARRPTSSLSTLRQLSPPFSEMWISPSSVPT
jgi:hypothetical protein